MNALERELHYPLGDTLPAPGTTLELAPGVRWIRMALPFALDHINLWLLRDRLPDEAQPGHWREGWTVVDCGVDTPDARAAWLTIEASTLQGLPILRVIVTHMHPDHAGLAHWLCQRWQAPLWMSATEYQAAQLAQAGITSFASQATSDFFAAHGWPQDAELQASRQRGRYPELVPSWPQQFVRLMDGQTLQIGERRWRCLDGHGHSPEHIALLCTEDALCISGDMLLPAISSNVSVYAQEPDGDPLQGFLQSLARMRVELPQATLVLPSHGRPFLGAHARIDALVAHHRERLEELLEACQTRPHCAHEVLPLLFGRPLNSQQTGFAMGEAVAHLNHLWLAGRLQRVRAPDGTYRFCKPESASPA